MDVLCNKKKGQHPTLRHSSKRISFGSQPPFLEVMVHATKLPKFVFFWGGGPNLFVGTNLMIYLRYLPPHTFRRVEMLGEMSPFLSSTMRHTLRLQFLSSWHGTYRNPTMWLLRWIGSPPDISPKKFICLPLK